MIYAPMLPSGKAPTDVLGVYITYQAHELDALGHLLEFLRNRFHVTDEDLANKRKFNRILARHPLCQIIEEWVSLPKLLSRMFTLEDVANVSVAIGFRFLEDRTTFRVYKALLDKTTAKDLKSARDVYDEVYKAYFPDKNKMN